MKKIRHKIFLVICSILSIISFCVCVFSFCQSYQMQSNMIERTLHQMSDARYKPDRSPFKAGFEEFENKVFLGLTTYTVILDSEGKYKEVINNNGDETNLDNIKEIAENIINNPKLASSIDSLLTRHYVVGFTNIGLVVIDISPINALLWNALLHTGILMACLEGLIVLVTHFLTKWIMKPILENSERQKAFIADASHELKTPLAIIITSSDMYDQDHDPKWLDNIKIEAEHMSSLVNHLLKLSKSEHKNLVLKDINFSKLVENYILTTESLFYEKNLHLNYRIDENVHLQCDQERIKELLSILIDNAIKHCSKDGHVNIFLAKNHQRITLKVENTGDPILPDEEAKIFERFYRSDGSRNRNDNRYGLGLAIAKNIVEIHHGSIKAYSEGGITTFQAVWDKK